MSILLSAISRYRTVYDGCLSIDVNLSRGNLEEACNIILQNREVLQSIRSGSPQECNQQLISLLTRATDRKFSKICSIIEDQLNQRISIHDNTLFIHFFSLDHSSKFKSIHLSTLLQLVQLLSLTDSLLPPVFSSIADFVLRSISPDCSADLHSTNPHSSSSSTSTTTTLTTTTTTTTIEIDDDDAMIILRPLSNSTSSTSSSLSNVFTVISYLLHHFFLLDSTIADYFEESVYLPVEQALLKWMKVSEE